MEEKINQAIKDALENAPERKFVESVDIAFTIKDVDLKNPNNRIKEEVRLPSGRGKELKIAMFAAGEAATKAKDAGIHVITPQEIEELGGKKGKAKKIANSYDFFLSEVPHMGLIGVATPLPGNPTMLQGSQTDAVLGLVGFQSLDNLGGVQPPGSTPVKTGKKKGKK